MSQSRKPRAGFAINSTLQESLRRDARHDAPAFAKKTRSTRRSVVRQCNAIAELATGDEVRDPANGEQAEQLVAKEQRDRRFRREPASKAPGGALLHRHERPEQPLILCER